MKVLQITTSSNWGAIGRIAEQINEEARSQGWETYTAYSRYLVPSGSKEIRIGNRVALLANLIGARLFDRAGLGMALPTKRLIRKIEKIKPDIIHLHNIHGYVVNYPILFEFLRNSNIPVVWTQHDFWAITGHCSHFVGINCEKWETKCAKCQLSMAYPRTFFDFSERNYQLKKHYFNLLDNITFVGVSQWVSDILGQSFLSDKRIITIPNGVDTNIFHPYKDPKVEGIPNNCYVIMGVASQWKSGKGFDFYCQLAKLIAHDELIVLVGANEEMNRILPPNIIGIPLTNSQEELALLYSRANVVLSLSSAETSGLTIIESFACGTPAVVFDNTALPILIEGDVGYVAKNKDIEDVYRKIELVRNSKQVDYATNCRKLAVSKYDKKTSCRCYIDLYNKACSAK